MNDDIRTSSRRELFEGNEPLIEELAIHDGWDWPVRHPFVRLSFGSGNFKEPGYVEASLMEQLAASERRATVVTEYSTDSDRLASLLKWRTAPATAVWT